MITELYPSAQFDPSFVVKQGLDPKKMDNNSFSNSFINLNEMTTFCKDQNGKSKYKNKNHEMYSTITKSIDALFNIAATTNSSKLSDPGFDLIVKQISIGLPCAFSLTSKVLGNENKQDGRLPPAYFPPSIFVMKAFKKVKTFCSRKKHSLFKFSNISNSQSFRTLCQKTS